MIQYGGRGDRAELHRQLEALREDERTYRSYVQEKQAEIDDQYFLIKNLDLSTPQGRAEKRERIELIQEMKKTREYYYTFLHGIRNEMTTVRGYLYE